MIVGLGIGIRIYMAQIKRDSEIRVPRFVYLWTRKVQMEVASPADRYCRYNVIQREGGHVAGDDQTIMHQSNRIERSIVFSSRRGVEGGARS